MHCPEIPGCPAATELEPTSFIVGEKAVVLTIITT
jgi:hypothetical protein